jgi:hypothetical protein
LYYPFCSPGLKDSWKLIEGGKQALRNNHLNPFIIIFFIIAIFKRLEIFLVAFPIDRHLKNPLFVTLVELLGNASVVGSSKVAVPVEVRRIVGKIGGLKPLLQ